MAIHTAANGWTYTDEHWNKYFNMDEKEVRRIFNEASAKLLTTTNLGVSETVDAKSTVAAIDSIWAEKKRRKETEEERKRAFEKLVNKTYLNLKAAYTPNGQLVASILEEEDGKTAEELKSWCNELLSLDDETYQQLLGDLVSDGVLLKEDDQYHLIRICSNLHSFGSDDLKKKWAQYQINKKESDNPISVKWGEPAKHFQGRVEYALLHKCSSEPFFPELYSFQIEGLQEVSGPYTKNKLSIIDELDWLANMGVLIKETTGVFEGCYRIPLLGEDR